MRKKLVIMAIFCFLFTLFGGNFVLADNNYSVDFDIIQDKDQLKSGDTVTYELKVTNINAGEGIASFSMSIDYDEEAFDLEVFTDEEGVWVKDEQISNLNPKIINLTTSDLRGTRNSQVIAKIAFTAKDGIKEGEQKITFKNISFSSEDLNEISVKDRNMKVLIVDDSRAQQNLEENNSVKRNFDNNDNAEISNERNIAWDIFEVILVIVAVGLILLTIMVYSRYKKSKNES